MNARMTERNIDLALLNCLDALIVECNVTLAADRLRMSQPGMSNALARLRHLLDDPILIRTTKGMVPTARALQLAPIVRVAIDQLSSIIADPAEFDPKGTTSVIRIAATDGTITCGLEPVIRTIQLAAPGMRIDIVPLQHGRLQEPLESGIIDLAFGVYSDLSPTLYSSKVINDSMCCVVARDGMYAGQEMTFERYCQADHAILSRGAGYRSTMETIADGRLATLNAERQIRFSAPYAGVVLSMVAHSNMVATFGTLGGRMYANWMPIELRPIPFDVPQLTYSMVWHERARNSVALTWVRQMLREGMRRRVDGEFPTTSANS